MSRPKKAKKPKVEHVDSTQPALTDREVTIDSALKISMVNFAYLYDYTRRAINDLSLNGTLPPHPGGWLPYVDSCRRMAQYLKEADAETKAIKRDQEQEKLFKLRDERWERDGRLIDKGNADRRLVGHIRRLFGFVREIKERRAIGMRFNWLRDLGVSPEVCREFVRRDSELAVKQITEIEQNCHKETQEGLNGEGI